MRTRPLPLLLAAALALPGVSVLAQDAPKPAPPATPPAAQQPPSPERPPGPQPGRGGPREEHRDDRRDGRGDQRHEGPRGPEDNRRGGDEGARRDGDRGDRGPGGPGGPGDRGDRGPGGPGGPGRDRSWHMPVPPAPPSAPTPYLGVVTLPPPPVLGAQLGLKEGFGLVVTAILPDSPAAKAGIKQHDVLTKFNDQQLVDGGQFATLVRGAGKDADATITLFRAAKEQTVQVKVGERLAPQRMPFPGGPEFRERMEKMRGSSQEGLNKLRDRMKEYEGKMREYQERLKGWQKNPTADMPQLPAAPLLESENGIAQITPADVLIHAQPGGTRAIRMIQPNGGAVSFYTADAKMFLKDESGDVEVTTKEGKRTLVAKDTKGDTVFDGPIDTEEQRKALPEDVRKKIELIVVRSAATPVDAPSLTPLVEGDVQ